MQHQWFWSKPLEEIWLFKTIFLQHFEIWSWNDIYCDEFMKSYLIILSWLVLYLVTNNFILEHNIWHLIQCFCDKYYFSRWKTYYFSAKNFPPNLKYFGTMFHHLWQKKWVQNVSIGDDTISLLKTNCKFNQTIRDTYISP